MKIKARSRADYMKAQNARYTERLEEIPRESWPIASIPEHLSRVCRSSQFLAQIFELPDGVIRITVCRTLLDGDDWAAEISWDSLQDIKRRLGYGDHYAVEVYPRETDLVNVASMRHLWVLAEPLNIGWFRGDGEELENKIGAA